MPKKAVLISIKPLYCELIANGEKTIEVRKTKPKLELPFKCYIYCTKPKMITRYVFKPEDYPEYMRPEKIIFCKIPDASSPFCSEVNGNSKVIGEFVCDEIYKYSAEFVESPKDTYEEIRQIWLDNEGDECDAIIATNERDDPNSCEICRKSCLSFDELREYIGVNFHDYPFYGWHISNLKIYDTPKELGEFYIEDKAAIKLCKHRFRCGQPESVTQHGGWIKGGYNCMKSGEPEWCENCIFKPLTRPPQTWCYVEEVEKNENL